MIDEIRRRHAKWEKANAGYPSKAQTPYDRKHLLRMVDALIREFSGDCPLDSCAPCLDEDSDYATECQLHWEAWADNEASKCQ